MKLSEIVHGLVKMQEQTFTDLKSLRNSMSMMKGGAAVRLGEARPVQLTASHPTHDVARSFMTGFGAVLSFETTGPGEIMLPADTWTLAADGCRDLSDGRTLVAWSVAPACDLGGEGFH